MQKIRLIPTVLIKNGLLVQSKAFKRHQILGNPSSILWRLTNWYSDEVIYLDISRDDVYDLNRDDLNFKNIHNIHEIIKEVSKKCFMPLTIGGKIRKLDHIYQRLNSGADKVSINTQAFRESTFIEKAAKEFGSQCIVVSMDAKVNNSGGWSIYIDGGKTPTDETPQKWAVKAQNLGAGEILLNSIDRDGIGKGYDIELISSVAETVSIPVIALGGVSKWEHLAEGIKAKASAVSAANIFHYTENSVYHAKKYLFDSGFNVREPEIKTILSEGV